MSKEEKIEKIDKVKQVVPHGMKHGLTVPVDSRPAIVSTTETVDGVEAPILSVVPDEEIVESRGIPRAVKPERLRDVFTKGNHAV